MSEVINIKELNERIERESVFVDTLRTEMGKVIIGQSHLVDTLLIGLLSNGHILLEGVPGLAKTLAITTLAKAVDAAFSRIQFTPDLLPADLIGTLIYSQKNEEFVVKKGPVFANFVLADEINRSPAKVQSALLEAMQERQVTIGDNTYPLPQPFLVLATQNPAGSAGTQLLPNSQLDRFLVKLTIGYPDLRSQVSILEERHTENPLDRVHAVVSAENLKNLKQEAAAVETKTVVYEYVAQLAEATRNHAMIQLGLSPRGALAVCRMAKAHAYVQGRDYAMPEDVAAIFPDVCCHRLLLNTKARMMERSPEQIVQEVLDSVEMPVIRRERA